MSIATPALKKRKEGREKRTKEREKKKGRKKERNGAKLQSGESSEEPGGSISTDVDAGRWDRRGRERKHGVGCLGKRPVQGFAEQETHGLRQHCFMGVLR